VEGDGVGLLPLLLLLRAPPLGPVVARPKPLLSRARAHGVRVGGGSTTAW
jgi:hypothetical protein